MDKYLDYTKEQIDALDYVSFMGILDENNRPPGGKSSIREILRACFLNQDSSVLHVGCNTGYSSYEINHLIKCKVTGIDLNEKMVAAANGKLTNELAGYKEKLSFKVGDARKLDFPDESFDLVFSAGSTAFMEDRLMCLMEFKRVCKTYGFIADTFLFYHKAPPLDLLKNINQAVGINIQPWDDRYWLEAYDSLEMERFYYEKHQMEKYPTDDDVLQYCRLMIQNSRLSPEVHELAVKKLYFYMAMFAENHKYLHYGVLIMRKLPRLEQISLFGS